MTGINILILQIRVLRLSKVKKLAQGQMEVKKSSSDCCLQSVSLCHYTTLTMDNHNFSRPQNSPS